jgi:hypothetical protein
MPTLKQLDDSDDGDFAVTDLDLTAVRNYTKLCE